MAETTGIGLLMATATSVSNVVGDVFRKKALDQEEVYATAFWCKIIATLGFSIFFFYQVGQNGLPIIKDGGAIFGIQSMHLEPLPTYLIYLTINSLLNAGAVLLYFRALQLSPISVTVPFMAFTPIFLIPTGYFLIGELPSIAKIIGVLLVVVGSLAMHRQLFAIGWLEPLKAVGRERGSLYVLIVAFIFSLTNPLDKILVLMTDAYTQAFAYGVSMCVLFAFVAIYKNREWWRVITKVPLLILFAGLMEALVLLLQFTSHYYIDVVITISLKRAGIVLAVLMGWLIFKEKNIRDRLIASVVMASGALMFYLPVTLTQSLIISATVILFMFAAFHIWKNDEPPAAKETLAAE